MSSVEELPLALLTLLFASWPFVVATPAAIYVIGRGTMKSCRAPVPLLAALVSLFLTWLLAFALWRLWPSPLGNPMIGYVRLGVPLPVFAPAVLSAISVTVAFSFVLYRRRAQPAAAADIPAAASRRQVHS